MKIITILFVLTILFTSCTKESINKDGYSDVNAKYYENAKTDTIHYSFAAIRYGPLCKEIYIRTYMPEESELTGTPNSYVENISNFPNLTKEESERILRETNGRLYADSTDRDFERYWYNEQGLIDKYENRRFGDGIHNECILSYNQNKTIRKIEINDIVTENIKYKNTTVIIENDTFVTVLLHNIVK